MGFGRVLAYNWWPSKVLREEHILLLLRIRHLRREVADTVPKAGEATCAVATRLGRVYLRPGCDWTTAASSSASSCYASAVFGRISTAERLCRRTKQKSACLQAEDKVNGLPLHTHGHVSSHENMIIKSSSREALSPSQYSIQFQALLARKLDYTVLQWYTSCSMIMLKT